MQNANTDLHRPGEAVAGVAKEFRMPAEKYATFCLSLHLCNDNVRIDQIVIQQCAVK